MSLVEHLFGANYVDRLQFVLLPECALTSRKNRDCFAGLPLESSRNGLTGVTTIAAPANARTLADVDGFNSRPVSVDVIHSGDLAAEFAASQGLKFAGTGGGTIIVAVSGASGQAGDFSATDLAAQGTWGVSEQSGAFTYSLPIEVPPAQAGAAPNVSLSYSSAGADAKTESTNGQTSVLGEGWANPTNFIERLYLPCNADEYGTNLLDKCWHSPYTSVPGEAAYTVSLNGATYDLIWDGGNRYRTSTEIGWRVTRHWGANNGDGGEADSDDEGEYFLVQVPDGSRYYFGYGHVGVSGSPTNSVATVPVFGDDTGEPRCGTDANDECVQGYRWMLDISVDASNNASTYTYTRDTNHYALKGDVNRITEYTAAIRLDDIKYGLVWGGLDVGVGTQQADAKVQYVYVERCVQAANYLGTLATTPAVNCPDMDEDNAHFYPDVPIDLLCDAATGSNPCAATHNSPVFFTTERLDQITTSVRDWADVDTNSDWVPVATTQLLAGYPMTGDGSARNLWLDGVYTKAWGEFGNVDDDLQTYVIKFDPIQLNNRVDFIPGDDDRRAVDRLRIERVRTEFGGHIEVEYARDIDGVGDADPDDPYGLTVCEADGFVNEAAIDTYYDTVFANGWDENSQLCSPSSNADDAPTFHKYMVTEVRLVDAVAPVPVDADEDGDFEEATSSDFFDYLTTVNRYDYIGEPAWAYADSIMSERGQGGQTWNVFRGYEIVESWVGENLTDYAVTRNQYYRGTSGGYLENGTLASTVELTRISDGTTVEDLADLSGMLAATSTVRREVDGQTVTDTLATASHSDYTIERAVALDVREVDLNLGVGAELIEVGDANNDGNADLLAWLADKSLVLYYGDGNGGVTDVDGTVVSAAWSTTADKIIAPGSWDSTVDDYVDLIEVKDGYLRLHRGAGDGTWASTSTQIGSGWGSFLDILVPGDWSGDSKPDILPIQTDSDLRLYTGNGTATSPTTVGVIAQIVDEDYMRFGDFDGDGKTDAAHHYDTDWHASYSGTGDWIFLGGSQYGADQVRFDGDFDGNGTTDMAMHTSSGWRVQWDSNSSWEYINDSTITANLWFVDVGVKTAGDPTGVDDIVWFTGSKFSVRWSGQGNWVDLNTSTLGSDKSFADIDGDGEADMIKQNTLGWLVWWSGKGPYEYINTDLSAGDNVMFGDFDGDGSDDLVRRRNGNWEYNSALLADSAAEWTHLIAEGGTSGEGGVYDYDDFHYEVWDFDGNGTSDLVRSGDGGWMVLYDGTGNWQQIAASQWAQYDTFVDGGDYNGDSIADIIAISAIGNVDVLYGEGDNGPPANAQKTVITNIGDAQQLVAPGDWNGDNVPDLLLLEADGTLMLHGGTPHTTSGDGSYYSQTIHSETSWSMVTEPGLTVPWVKTSTSTTAFDGQNLPITSESTVIETVDGIQTAGSPFTSCTAMEHLWRVDDDAATGDTNIGWDAVDGWGGDIYLSATWRTRTHEGACDDSEKILTGVSETYFDGATWDDNEPQDLLTRGLVTTEIAYPIYEGATAAAKRGNAAISVAEYDARGRIAKAWMPNDVSLNATTGALETNNSFTTWTYGAFATSGDHAGLAELTVGTTVEWAEGVPTTYSTSQWVEPTRGSGVKSIDLNEHYTHYRFDPFGLLEAGYASTTWDGATAPWLESSYVIPTASFEYDVYAPGVGVRSTPVTVTSAQHAGYDAAANAGAGQWVCQEAACFVKRSYMFLDGWGRAVEQHRVAPDGSGGRLVSATRYNKLGHIEFVASTFWNEDAAQLSNGRVDPVLGQLDQFATTTVDWAGRATTQSVWYRDPTLGLLETKTDTVFLGNISQVEAASGAITETKNDVLGRLVRQSQHPETGYELAEAFNTIYSYETLTDGGSKVTVTDPDDNDTVFVSNMAGQRTSLDDPNSGLSAYTYDLNGQTTSVDSEAGLIMMVYDTLGRMIERYGFRPGIDPDDSGTVWADYLTAEWTYNVGQAGLPAAAPDGALVATSATTWVPDGGTGFDSYVTIQTTDDWDALGRPTESTLTLPTTLNLGELSGDMDAGKYTRTIEYDELSRPTVTLPAIAGLPEQTILNGYNRFGTPVTLDVLNNPGPSQTVTPIVTGVGLDELGRLTSRSYANTVDRLIQYDAQWGAPERIAAVFDPGTGDIAIQDDVFVRDDVGRVTSIQDDSTYESANPHEAQCFVYDGHNRLANAWTEATDGFTDTCDTFATLPTTQTEWDASAWAASAGPYATTWEYSDSGRIESITNLIEDGLSGSTESVQAFEYDSDGNGTELSVNDLPHAVSGVDNDGDSTVDDTFEYGTAGRQTVRTVDGVTSTLTWDVSSNLVKAVVDDGTNEATWVYVYDASGQRVTKIQLDGSTPIDATAYFGETEVTDTDTSTDGASDVTAVRYYQFGGATVALEQSVEHPTSPTVDLFYLFGDFQGSAQVMMSDARDVNGNPDPTNADILRNAYTPYGAQRSIDVDVDTNPDPNLPTERGWLSQIRDEPTDTAGTLGTGLTYLNARYYDPVTARFLSPDPLMNPQDPRTLDPYRYADNNPVLYTDASGLCTNMAMATFAAHKACETWNANNGDGGITGGNDGGSDGAGNSGGAGSSTQPSEDQAFDCGTFSWYDGCSNDIPAGDFNERLGFVEGLSIAGWGFTNFWVGVGNAGLGVINFARCSFNYAGGMGPQLAATTCGAATIGNGGYVPGGYYFGPVGPDDELYELSMDIGKITTESVALSAASGLAAGTALTVSRTTANLGATGTTQLGTYPIYIDRARATGASYFNVGNAWNWTTRGARAAANTRFLNTTIANADRVLTTTPRIAIQEGTALYSEIAYLEANGYRWVNQWALVLSG